MSIRLGRRAIRLQACDSASRITCTRGQQGSLTFIGPVAADEIGYATQALGCLSLLGARNQSRRYVLAMGVRHMTSDPLLHEDLFGMAEARRARRSEHDDDMHRRGMTASGAHFPTADQLLRGYPLLGQDIARDIQCFVASVLLDQTDAETLSSLQHLNKASREIGADGALNEASILDAIRKCRFSSESDRDGAIRLRCVIYAALLGDVDAAQRVAGEAALFAYVQDWHLEGDGSELVWQALAWAALSSARLEPFRALTYPISKMSSVKERIDAFAYEFRLQVGRVLPELD